LRAFHDEVGAWRLDIVLVDSRLGPCRRPDNHDHASRVSLLTLASFNISLGILNFAARNLRFRCKMGSRRRIASKVSMGHPQRKATLFTV
jgi:hypothetical protein